MTVYPVKRRLLGIVRQGRPPGVDEVDAPSTSVHRLSGSSMSEWPFNTLQGEQSSRSTVRDSLDEWALLALSPQGHAPAAHHRLLIRELEGLSRGSWDRLMLLLPPGSAKSTYAVLNVLLGSLTAMATSVVSYWVGSSVGSARKDARIGDLLNSGR